MKKLFFPILLIFKISLASQQEEEGVSFFYDESTNTQWVCGNQNFKKLVIDEATRNCVLQGDIRSDSDIQVRAQNLILLGSLVATKKIQFLISHDIFNAANVTTETLNIKADTVYDGLSDTAIAKIQKLGIDISFSDPECTSLVVKRPIRIYKPD